MSKTHNLFNVCDIPYVSEIKNVILECSNAFPWWQSNPSWSIHSGFMFFIKNFHNFRRKFFRHFLSISWKIQNRYNFEIEKNWPDFLTIRFLCHVRYAKTVHGCLTILFIDIYHYPDMMGATVLGFDPNIIQEKSWIMNHLYLWHHS